MSIKIQDFETIELFRDDETYYRVEEESFEEDSFFCPVCQSNLELSSVCPDCDFGHDGNSINY